MNSARGPRGLRHFLARGPLLLAAVALSGCGEDALLEPELDPLVVTTTALPNGVQGVPYLHMLEAAGGDGSYRWAITGAMFLGSPPSGLWVQTDGELSGTPAFVETQGFTVEVRSGDGQATTQALSLTITAPPE